MSKRKKLIGVGAVVALVIVVGLAYLLLRGPETATAGPVKFEIPSGWSVQNNGDRGIVIAKSRGDLLRRKSQGPRLAAGPIDPSLPKLSELVDGGDQDIEHAGELVLDGHSAVESVNGDTREITVSLGDGKAWQITITRGGEETDEMLLSIKFDPSQAKAIDVDILPADDGSTAEDDDARATDSPPEIPDGDAGPGSDSHAGDEGRSLDSDPGDPGEANPATAATNYAVDKYGMRPSEPVLGEYRSETNPDWTLVTFDMGGRQIAVWTREVGYKWQAIVATEGGYEAPKKYGVPKDLYPSFG